MPKKFSPSDKNKWLEKYESGKSESSIANESKCDIRTIRRGIEEARRERDARAARIDLIKQAIFKHQESLLGKLGEILLSLQIPSHDWAVLSWHENGESILSESNFDTEDALEGEVGKDSKNPDAQVDMVEDMLRQHLRNDKLWKILARRKQIYASHRSARIALQRKVANILEGETGYNMEARGDVPPPFLYSHTTGDLFYRMTLGGAFGDRKNDAWQDEIVVDTSANYVKYRNSILAEVPSAANECRENLLNAFRKMRTLPEVTRVVNTYEELDESTLRAKQAIEEIRLLGLVPGVCKICRRLGM
jgi:hypothetical protein